jgi:hypothetical protein
VLRLLFADDQVMISNTEVDLQEGRHKLNEIKTENGLTASAQKNK